MKNFTTLLSTLFTINRPLRAHGTRNCYLILTLILLVVGAGKAWGDAFWPYAGFYEVYMTYSYNSKSSNYTFRVSDNNASDVNLGVLTADFNVTSLYLKCYKNNNDWSKYGNICGGLMVYGDKEYQPTWTWSDKGWDDGFQAHKQELSNTDTKTLASHNGNSGNYTVTIAFKVWGSDDNKTDCNDIWWISNNSKNYKFNYAILPPAVSAINISASGCFAGNGTAANPYILAYGTNLKLTASVTNNDANSDTYFTFGSNAASKTDTYTISNVTNTSVQKLTIKAQNINKDDNSLKGTHNSIDVYYKYEPVYLYINSTNYQFDNTTKKVTVALDKNNSDETYTFKIHDDSSHWLGNSGTMQRGGISVHSGGWTMSSSENSDCQVKADLTGEYVFTFIPEGNKITVTYPTKSYFIAGSWNEWAEDAPSFADASTPVTIHLEKGSYTFKIFHFYATSAQYYGNNGEMTRNNCTGWTMSTSEDNCRMVADAAGDYEFRFDVSTKKLSVTYPTHSITWVVNRVELTGAALGSATTQVADGQKITALPTPPDAGNYCGERFVGWTNAPISGMQAGKPVTLFKNVEDSPVIKENTTFYAVFADIAE